MGLGSAELPVLPTPEDGASRSTFAAALTVVVPAAQRRQVRLIVVIAAANMVNIRCRLDAAATVVIQVRAPVTVPAKDATAEDWPVRR